MARQAGGLVNILDLPRDSGWQDLPLPAGITASGAFPPEYLRVVLGPVALVFLRGRVSGVSAATNTAVGILPADCLPDVGVYELGIIPNSGSTKARVWVTNDATNNVWARTDSGTDAFLYGVFVAAYGA